EHVRVNLAHATLIDGALAGRQGQRLLHQLVGLGRDQLEKDKFEIRLRIRAQSPWWMPKFVDEEIYDQLVGEFERILNEVGDNPAHPARRQLNERLRSIKYSLETDAEILSKGRALWGEVVEHPAVQDYLQDLWERVRVYLHESLTRPDSEIRLGIEQEIRN